MRERPIIFNSEMVRAILDGRKTQTRRIIKINSPTIEFDTCNPPWPTCADQYGDFYRVPCKYGKPGDRLWVREAWAKALGSGLCNPLERYIKDDGDLWGIGAIYKSTPHPDYGQDNGAKWKPSIHMPRWASRITLEIVHVRVERLNDISEEDAKSEGADKEYLPDLGRSFALHVRGFHSLWESIYGKGSWEVNPWVWVLEFKRI